MIPDEFLDGDLRDILREWFLKDASTADLLESDPIKNRLDSYPGPDADWDWGDRARLGGAWIRLGDAAKGLHYLRSDWRQSPPDAAGFAGSCLLQQGLITAALPALITASQGLPEVAAHAVNLGRCLVLLGRDEQALPHLQRGLTLLDPEQCPCDHNLALCSLAEALQQLGRIDEALALFPATSSDEVIITARAALLAGSGRHDQAAVLLAETLQEHPKADRVRLMAADLADLRGRTGEAIGWLKQGARRQLGRRVAPTT